VTDSSLKISSNFNVFAWLFVRLPLGFSVPFSAISLWWGLGGFAFFNAQLATPFARSAANLIQSGLPPSIGYALVAGVGPCAHAVLVIALFLAGFVFAYNTSALVNWLLVVLHLKPIRYAAGPPRKENSSVPPNDPIGAARRIGIVLAGGGAKGAYQAGAMKAIYRFLAERGALQKVSVIASTSIGSWNALFWLADLVQPESDWTGRSVHERWWRSISAKSLVAPSWYIPFCRNAFLSPLPWQQAFERLFARQDVARRLQDSHIHFYFTRSNVRTGQLQCVTNNPQPPEIDKVSYEVLDRSADPQQFLRAIKQGVFASMDLPPLFPYMRCAGEWFEDGGVIDNLPLMFPALERCDLLFVLPLNSDFEAQPNTRSIFARLLRVMEVRQGALERGGFKTLYLYNELAALRQQLASLQKHSPNDGLRVPGPLSFALQRQHELINVFAVCPLKSFVEQTINTLELWKRKEAGLAFDIMHAATASVLPKFQFQSQDSVRVALVGRDGGIAWDEKF